jgi:hypothetical protein
MHLRKILVLFFSFFITLLGAALSLDTLVHTSSGMKVLASVERNNCLASWNNLQKQGEVDSAVKKLHSYQSHERYSLVISGEVVVCSASQKFLPHGATEFVYASDLQPGTQLQTKTGSCVECSEIVISSELTEFVDISLAPSPPFFIGNCGVVTHNVAILMPTLIAHIETWLVGTVIAQLFFANFKPQMFTDFLFGKSHVIEQAKRFAHEDYPWRFFDMDSPGPQIPRKMVDIDVSPRIFGKFTQYPQAFGPMCATTELNADGMVTCDINVFHYLNADTEYQYFGWEKIGNANLRRDDLFVQEYLQQEDTKWLEDVKKAVTALPNPLKKLILICGTKKISESLLSLSSMCSGYGFQFGTLNILPCALANMVDEKISPHAVAETFFYGQKAKCLRQEGLSFIVHAKRNLCIIADDTIHDIIAVGKYRESLIDSQLSLFNTHKLADEVDLCRAIQLQVQAQQAELKQKEEEEEKKRKEKQKDTEKDGKEDDKKADRDNRKEQEEKDKSAQAPGKPTEKDGYRPPKKWDGKKVKTKNGRGYGYPDEKGDIWVPSGPNGHGGPHWDVQNQNGTSYKNVYPGGLIR